MALMLTEYKVHRLYVGKKEQFFRTYRGINQYLEKLNIDGWTYVDKDKNRLSRRKILSVYQLENKNVVFTATRNDEQVVCRLHKLTVLN